MSDFIRRSGLAKIFFTATLVAASGIAFAQEAIQEIVVTAQRRVENIQTVPIAITAISGEELAKQGVTDYSGIASASAVINFTPYPSSSNMMILFMRGLGVADPNQITQDGSVGLYEDGFYISRPQLSTFDLADVERVEVLRGPQGTLYGRNTTGGAVNIVSQKPSGELDFKGKLTYGSRNDTRALATMNLPRVGGLAAKLTLLYSNLDGYVRNPGGNDFGIERQKAGRLSLNFERGGPFTADYYYEYGDIDSTPIYYQDPALDGLFPGYYGSGRPNSVAYRPFDLPLSTGTNQGHGLTLAWAINDSTTLKSLTGYRTLVSDAFQDYAEVFSNPATVPFIGLTGFTSDDIIHSHQFSEELQLVGDIGHEFNYVAGLYLFRESGRHVEYGGIDIPGFQPFLQFGIPAAFHQRTTRFVTADAKSTAAFAQGTYRVPGFDDKLALTLGLRYTKDTRDATRTWTGFFVGVPAPFIPFPPEAPTTNSVSFSKFNPAGTIAYQWTPDVQTYLRVATGYKAGGSSEADLPAGVIAPNQPDEFPVTFAPETITQYELGLKSSWLEHRLRANVAIFHSDVKDLQSSFNVYPANLAYVLTINAGKLAINGAEVELFAVPVKDLTIGLEWAYLDTKLSDILSPAGSVFDPAVNPSSPYPVGSDISAVFRENYAPRNIITANVDWIFARVDKHEFSARLNYRYQDRQYTTNTTGPAVPGADLYAIPGHGLLDARLTWKTELENKKAVQVSAWMNNVADKRYAQHVIGQGNIIPLLGAPAGLTFQAIAWAPRPLYGIDISYGF